MNFAKLNEFMEAMPARGIPACEIAVTKDGKTVYRKCVGYSDAAGTKPVTENDLYWIFSATKVITCIAAMRLVEAGKLRLNDPVSKYIPAYESLKIQQKDGTVIPARNTMTVEHLFTMSSGMTYDLKTPSILGATDRSTIGLAAAMANDPLKFEPGTHYRYSLSHDVLAAIVEIVSGRRFSDYLESQIFAPLGIHDMGFRPNDEQKARFSAMYTYQSGVGRALERPIENAYILSDTYDSGGAGLFASVDEYIKIISVIACGGTAENGYTVLRPETIRLMQENRLCDDALNDFVSGRLYGYGWGLCGRVHIDPVRSLSLSPVGEFGWDGAAGAFVMIDPENRVAVYYGQHIKSCSYVYHVAHSAIRNFVYEGLSEK